MKGLFLSIDFDFFTRENPLWDWGHRETGNPMWDHIMWHSRLSQFASVGVDPMQETNPDVHSPIRPGTFWDVMARSGLDVSGARLHIADSHMYGAFSHGLDGRSVVHIDAHHDLGYHDLKTTRKNLREQNADCADWLLHVLHRNKGARTEQYLSPWASPEGHWMDLPVAKRVRQTGLHLSERDRIEATGLPGLTLTGKVSTVFICKSGTWVPPWWDHLFVQFIRDAETRTGSKRYNMDEQVDPMKVRMSFDEALSQYTQHRKTWTEVRARQQVDLNPVY